MNGINTDKMKEECGVLGFYDNDGFEVSKLLYFGLLTLQHRGESSCGIVTDDGTQLHTIKKTGLVTETFTDEGLEKLKGHIGVGHVRFAESESPSENDIQPLVSKYVKGFLTIASNGNITNAQKIKASLENEGSIFQSGCDCEIVTHMLAKERTRNDSMRSSLLKIMGILEGAYSMVIMSPGKLFGVRDPHGYRPLCICRLGSSYILSSESVALESMGAELIRDVMPGELVLIDKNGITSYAEHCGKKPSLCSYEYIFYSRPDSVVDGLSVYDIRMNIGKQLAKEAPAEADIVIGVPSSGLHFALGYSRESGVPFGDGLIKNYYLGRGPLLSKIERESAVNIKLNVLGAAVRNKRIILVDDSMVRGTTMKTIVKMLKNAGAAEVHVRIAAPETKYRCTFGAVVTKTGKLISAEKTPEEISGFIGCDSLKFLSIDSLSKIGLRQDFGYCKSCFTGDFKNK